MISLGVVRIDSLDSTSEKLIIANYGTFVLGGRCKIHPGAKVYVGDKATLRFSNRVSIGSCTKIVCYKTIQVGEEICISWNCQLLDTDFHFLRKVETGKIYPRTKPIILGDNCFVGNNCTIGKGVVLTNGSVVSCCSKVSGDFTEEGENLLISGNPARVVAKGFNFGNGFSADKEREIAKLMEE